jgi:hypothetical protein
MNALNDGQGKVVGTSNDRLFYTLPNFLTLETKKQLPPMSVGDKFKVVALGTFDYVEYPWWGVLAAISQATNGRRHLGKIGRLTQSGTAPLPATAWSRTLWWARFFLPS